MTDAHILFITHPRLFIHLWWNTHSAACIFIHINIFSCSPFSLLHWFVRWWLDACILPSFRSIISSFHQARRIYLMILILEAVWDERSRIYFDPVIIFFQVNADSDLNRSIALHKHRIPSFQWHPRSRRPQSTWLPPHLRPSVWRISSSIARSPSRISTRSLRCTLDNVTSIQHLSHMDTHLVLLLPLYPSRLWLQVLAQDLAVELLLRPPRGRREGNPSLTLCSFFP